jgi:hypothetical protein
VNSKQTFVRKHYFINRPLQGRYMITFMVPMLLMLVFFLCILYVASQSIIITTTRIIKEDIETAVSSHLQDSIEPSSESYIMILKDIRTYIRDFSSNVKYRKAVLVSLLWVFGIGLLFIIIQIALLTIFFSHKLAGPIFRFERTLNAMMEGNYTETIHLRKGDEMQNLARLINQVIAVTVERFKAIKNASTPAQKDDIFSRLKL